MGAIQPGDARSLFYLALENQAVGRLAEAEDLYRQASSLAPERASVLVNLSAVLLQRKKYREAAACADRALERLPDDADAWLNKGVSLKLMMRHEEALASIDRAIALRPGHADALRQRGHVLHKLARYEEAAASYREALRNGGAPEELRYYLAALGAEPPPAISPAQLMTGLFDDYAADFDRHQAAMRYCAPQAVFDAVAGEAPPDGWDIGDLGCGTGLCGPLFRPLARRFTGVDLSANMIEKARERNVYDALIQGDVCDFLRARHGAFDLLIAADVFIYVGDLDPVFRAARASLRGSGLFAFSLETHQGNGYVLRQTRRYAQSVPYLLECAGRNGFAVFSVTPLALRQEYGRDVDGVIAVLRSGDG